MARDNIEFESAKRHLGVAMIDLSYAEAELRHSGRSLYGLAGEESRIAADLLAEELSRLRKLGLRIERIGKVDPDGLSLSDLSRWWPTEIRRRSSRAE